jgi:hypothetical protein
VDFFQYCPGLVGWVLHRVDCSASLRSLEWQCGING